MRHLLPTSRWIAYVYSPRWVASDRSGTARLERRTEAVLRDTRRRERQRVRTERQGEWLAGIRSAARARS